MSPCKTVLVVEDDETIRETLRLALELKGYDVITAGNGKEGIEALADRPAPCLILLDLMMPVMDGWGFVEALQAQPTLSAIPVVVVTAFGNKADTICARSVIAKPLPLDLLYKTVHEHCGDGGT